MPDAGRSLAAHLAGMMQGAGVSLSWADPRQDHRLLPEEAAQTAGMVPKRRAEFSAGRLAAHGALQDLGLPLHPLLKGEDRAPVWPAGVVGSITHCEDVCLAAASRDLRGLGIDVERNRPLPREARELIWCAGDRITGSDGGDDGMRLFCAKEAAFKAQYALSRALIGPDVLELRVDPFRFVARFTESVGPFAAGTRLEGRVRCCGDHILACCAIV